MAEVSTDSHEIAQLDSAYARLREAWSKEGALPYKRRMALLKALGKVVKANQTAICEALNADFGSRSTHETRLAEVWPLLMSIDHTRTHLQDWMEPKVPELTWHFQPASARVVYQAKGVVGIIGPWNYPFQLPMMGIVAAIGAGCRVLVRPSEVTPATGALIARLVGEVFQPGEVSVVNGGPAQAAAFSSLPLDHILFTGSTRVGKLVMKAAAENLTPVTLELGGKSPAVIHPDFSLDTAAGRIAYGKLLNAGQTCIAPDYVLVHKSKVDAFCEAFGAAVRSCYPRLGDNPDYTAIINDHHYKRLSRQIDEARDRGAKIIEINPASEVLDPARRKIAPTLVVGAPADAECMTEEIFGPILPVVGVDSVEEAIAYINARPRPLALYYFDRSGRRVDHLLQHTLSGGVTVNDTMLHFTSEEMPFGGVGPSGMGAYHGLDGFRTFTHARAVFEQSRINALSLFNPPYGKLMDAALKLFNF
jgi:coniferyl-aldehyde dehydrogenase